MTTDEVLFQEMHGQHGDIGIIVLNRPTVLNALNHAMVQAMFKQLTAWASATPIKAVVIRANGRAFCAGGDLRLTYDRYQAKDPLLTHFFRDEYQLNQLIHHYPKPYIAFMHGITMGGGVGLSLHGSHRVATDHLVFAMPETGIGFYPDVGGRYFLPRLPGKMGFYLGLTGAKINSDDCIALGITQHKIAVDALDAVIQAILDCDFADAAHEAVTTVINTFQVAVQSSALMAKQAALDACFSATSIEAIFQRLQTSTDATCRASYDSLQTKSPLSLKVTLRALQEGAALDFDTCMLKEYPLACHFLQGHDFPEGIRAMIIDKDQAPNWQPRTVNAVTLDEVEKYFH